ncbi:hypothetical protein CEXT_688051 [Caerostris extrusa]|uniref:Uncharacterized protein n=1 Tax=Caerostris extrusa TaxID=172846 RepID=A0AAV4QNH4_CAEEX|nr:hypothetical protein CEXT_688051 [Caerostris extrusa]
MFSSTLRGKLGMGDGEFERMGEIAPGCWDGYIMHPGSNGRRVLGVEGEKEIRTVKRSLYNQLLVLFMSMVVAFVS